MTVQTGPTGQPGLRSALVLVTAVIVFASVAPPSASRWAAIRSASHHAPTAIAANAVLAALAVAVGAVTASGAAAGAVLGSLLIVGMGWTTWLLLVAMFAGVVAATRIARSKPDALPDREDGEGRRGIGNAIGNTGFAASAAMLHLMTGSPTAAWAAAAALITSGSDSIASEIGRAFGGAPWHPLQLRRVPAGTPGAMSTVGTAAGIGSAFALAAFAALIDGWHAGQMAAVALGASTGWIGEALLAAPLEQKGFIDNDEVNLIGSGLGALAVTSLLVAFNLI